MNDNNEEKYSQIFQHFRSENEFYQLKIWKFFVIPLFLFVISIKLANFHLLISKMNEK